MGGVALWLLAAWAGIDLAVLAILGVGMIVRRQRERVERDLDALLDVMWERWEQEGPGRKG